MYNQRVINLVFQTKDPQSKTLNHDGETVEIL